MRSSTYRFCLNVFITVLLCSVASIPAQAHGNDSVLRKIKHIVVIYGENRSFDNLYGLFPGARGISDALAHYIPQKNLDGSDLPVLPPVWAKAGEVDPSYPPAMSNKPFQIDALQGKGLAVPTRDLVHRFYQNQAQINDGRNDMFAALSDAGGLAMGYYDGSPLPLWEIAKQYTLADNFFMGAFGGSFLNHFWLVCACTPEFKDAPEAIRAKLGADGKLLPKSGAPITAFNGPMQFMDGAVTPDGYAINTLQPPFQPSDIAAAKDGDPQFADPANNPLPSQSAPTIGDRLSDKGISWAWYASGWRQAQADRSIIYNKENINFQPHHQPLNYFRQFAPGTSARAEHLKDGDEFLAAIDKGALPQVSFYKPQGTLNEHPGYTDVMSGDAHIASIIEKIRNSSQWKDTLIIVTYDENGGFWDHVAPPQGDRWGPGTRIPTLIISPLARKHYVDHSRYDTTSILKLITRRFRLLPLPGVRQGMGDLSNALK